MSNYALNNQFMHAFVQRRYCTFCGEEIERKFINGKFSHYDFNHKCKSFLERMKSNFDNIPKNNQ